MRMTQGQEANYAGNFLEQAIEREFRARGVHIADEGTFGQGDLLAPRQLVPQVQFVVPWGPWKCDFVYQDETGYGLAIECKNQESGGSVEWKYPPLIDYGFLRAVPAHYDCWLIINGSGVTPGMMGFLRHRCMEVRERKIIKVLNMEEARSEIKVMFGGRGRRQ
jgi:hypothetical protein